jgi:hypothetical protein
MPSIFEVLSTAAGDLIPGEGDKEQDYLTNLIKALNKIDEEKFDALPEDAQNWFNDAVVAVQHKTPIQKLPGAPFEDLDNIEAVQNTTANTAKNSDEEEPPLPLENGKDIDEATTAPAAKRKAGRPPKNAAKASPSPLPAEKGDSDDQTSSAQTEAPKTAAQKKKAAAEAAKKKREIDDAAAKKKRETDAKNKVVSARGSEGGVLDLLLEAVYKNPGATPKVLKEHVESENKNVVVKIANAIGIRQQFRRVVRLLQRHDALKVNIDVS